MRNSASIPSTIQAGAKQALQRHAQQILPALTALFSDLNYSEIAHQRISQQSNSGEVFYQGLTCAQHPQFATVMIKWQLSIDANQNSADLIHEAGILRSINSLSNNQNGVAAIAPPILAYDNLRVQILAQSLPLTILVMPYYPNGNLATQLNSRNHLSLTAQKKHRFIVQATHLVANLHNAGWLHNDIKPSNILLDGSMQNHADNSRITSDVLLTDFALAEGLNAPILASPAGTPAYLAPERWQGYAATLQCDIYAFGIMVYEILTGMRPFNIANQRSEPLKEWAIQHCQQPVPTLSLEYSRYQDIIDKALTKRVEKRYQSMDEILLDLESMGK
ncbi:protein kinase domain-containing protein [Psychrobacter sp. ANT_WB68]|uniref:protein kinase domain-containing protein n=1 Tax=Psychrobacter sp. ANT_WB68 TaxID=2597355 RepID=UPI0011F276E8|nr:protein kinase [Psychrobacter sp. ANT_WB68]KAA0914103.1 protein kinase [Psychrobacter sp. ANT_WB68]